MGTQKLGLLYHQCHRGIHQFDRTELYFYILNDFCDFNENDFIGNDFSDWGKEFMRYI